MAKRKLLRLAKAHAHARRQHRVKSLVSRLRQRMGMLPWQPPSMIPGGADETFGAGKSGP